jgi:hypothetical protein
MLCFFIHTSTRHYIRFSYLLLVDFVDLGLSVAKLTEGDVSGIKSGAKAGKAIYDQWCVAWRCVE